MLDNRDQATTKLKGLLAAASSPGNSFSKDALVQLKEGMDNLLSAVIINYEIQVIAAQSVMVHGQLSPAVNQSQLEKATKKVEADLKVLDAINKEIVKTVMTQIMNTGHLPSAAVDKQKLYDVAQSIQNEVKVAYVSVDGLKQNMREAQNKTLESAKKNTSNPVDDAPKIESTHRGPRRPGGSGGD